LPLYAGDLRKYGNKTCFHVQNASFELKIAKIWRLANGRATGLFSNQDLIIQKMENNACKLAYLIEGDTSFQNILQQHLRQFGYDVRCFTSARRCLEAGGRRPDLILLSQQLENNEQGIDFIEEIRKKYRRVPIVMLANDGDVYTGARALEMGAFDYIEKNGAALVRLRTTLDNIPIFLKKQRQQKIMLWVAILAGAAGVLAAVVFLLTGAAN
jgi:CheY-like chemotaxis protein